MTEHVLNGLCPTPLASYLAGLGLVRLLGEQADPETTARWRDDALVVDAAVDDVAAWLVDTYVPTPVLSPWNEGSGFGAKDVTPRQKLAELMELPSPRLEPFREAIDTATEMGRRYRERLAAGGKKDAAKAQAVREFRNTCPERLLPWLDATVVLGDDTYFPPLLGTGGNDGRLDFSTTFHQRLRDVLDPGARTRALRQAQDLLAGTQEERLQDYPIGQFDPASSGGKNSSPYGAAGSLVNPWTFILAIEGALLFAASVARRRLHHARRAAMPFTVFASPDGSASGADGEASRGEVWAPVWRQPFTIAEITQLFTEARAAWRGRPAERAVDFYAATRTLGVARGVGAFQRYGLHQRNGLAFLAVPIDRVEVREKQAVRLARHLEDWVSWVRRGESTTAVGRAVRRFDAAHLAFARDGEVGQLVDLLAVLTDLEQAAGRSGRTRDAVPVRRPPDAADFLTAFAAEECAEMRVAVGLASCATRRGPDGEPPWTPRHLLLPVDPDGRWRAAPIVPGFGVRPLERVLADVMVWRSRTAPDEPHGTDAPSFRGVPTFPHGVPVPAADLHALAAGRLNPARLDRWLRACLALRWDRVRRPAWATSQPRAATAQPRADGVQIRVLVPTLALLHPLAAGLAPEDADPDAPRLALSPDWAPRLAAGQIIGVHTDAVRRLRQGGWEAVPAPPHTDHDGAALAAALVPRCAGDRDLLRRVAVPLRAADTGEDRDEAAGDGAAAAATTET